MTARNHLIGPGLALARLPHSCEARAERLARVRDKRRTEPRHTVPLILAKNLQDLIRGETRITEPDPAVAIDLQVKEPRSDPRQVGLSGIPSRRSDARDPPRRSDFDPHRLTGFKMLGDDRHRGTTSVGTERTAPPS